MMNKKEKSPFNSSLESGVRALTILASIYPQSADLQRLVDFDYLIVHSGDADGPESLHAPLPMRAGELLVRRSIVESGLLLMMSRGLLERVTTENGIEYVASEIADAFVNSLFTPYLVKLKERARWVADKFGDVTEEELHNITKRFFDKWTAQFHAGMETIGDSNG